MTLDLTRAYPAKMTGALVREAVDRNGGSLRKCAEATGMQHMRLHRLVSGISLPTDREFSLLEMDNRKEVRLAAMADKLCVAMIQSGMGVTGLRKALKILEARLNIE